MRDAGGRQRAKQRQEELRAGWGFYFPHCCSLLTLESSAACSVFPLLPLFLPFSLHLYFFLSCSFLCNFLARSLSLSHLHFLSLFKNYFPLFLFLHLSFISSASLSVQVSFPSTPLSTIHPPILHPPSTDPSTYHASIQNPPTHPSTCSSTRPSIYCPSFHSPLQFTPFNQCTHSLTTHPTLFLYSCLTDSITPRAGCN